MLRLYGSGLPRRLRRKDTAAPRSERVVQWLAAYSIPVGPMVGPGNGSNGAGVAKLGHQPERNWTRGHSLLALMGRSDLSH